MIHDSIENLHKHEAKHQALGAIAEFIRANPLASLQSGITKIHGDDLYVNVMEYETHPIDNGASRLENHHAYADVHIIEEPGQENIRVVVTPSSIATVQYEIASDVEFFQQDDSQIILLAAGYFMLLLPNEAHEPGCVVEKPQLVRKCVFKIKI